MYEIRYGQYLFNSLLNRSIWIEIMLKQSVGLHGWCLIFCSGFLSLKINAETENTVWVLTLCIHSGHKMP